jgi:hypothetical protein
MLLADWLLGVLLAMSGGALTAKRGRAAAGDTCALPPLSAIDRRRRRLAAEDDVADSRVGWGSTAMAEVWARAPALDVASSKALVESASLCEARPDLDLPLAVALRFSVFSGFAAGTDVWSPTLLSVAPAAALRW